LKILVILFFLSPHVQYLTFIEPHDLDKWFDLGRVARKKVTRTGQDNKKSHKSVCQVQAHKFARFWATYVIAFLRH